MGEGFVSLPGHVVLGHDMVVVVFFAFAACAGGRALGRVEARVGPGRGKAWVYCVRSTTV